MSCNSFYQVQAQVKKTKVRFDKLKLDCMQKIDLLAASRCNMFSHVLANYQSTLLHFWSKTSRTMSAVAESFKGYQYYEFNMLKVRYPQTYVDLDILFKWHTYLCLCNEKFVLVSLHNFTTSTVMHCIV